jgi:SAM-dependent methyltransferase
MTDTGETVWSNGKLNVRALQRLYQKPPPFAPGERLFWDDPHISRQMLAAHLDPDADAASRKPEVIDDTVRWLLEYLDLHTGDAVLDLGCGPGLYCERFSRAGLAVTGIDYSRRSVEYAKAKAAKHHLAIHYVYGDFLVTPFPRGLSAILLIYGEFCVLPDDRRDALLRKVRMALRDGGHFIFDVTTRHLRQHVGARNSWSVAEERFWCAFPHLVLTLGFGYPEDDLYLDQYIVLTETGDLRVYRSRFHGYSLETLTQVLHAQGFAVREAWSDLEGSAYDSTGEWIGIAARAYP